MKKHFFIVLVLTLIILNVYFYKEIQDRDSTISSLESEVDYLSQEIEEANSDISECNSQIEEALYSTTYSEMYDAVQGLSTIDEISLGGFQHLNTH
jgi:peptidoglycan hydrolase CwlO-like protein